MFNIHYYDSMIQFEIPLSRPPLGENYLYPGTSCDLPGLSKCNKSEIK